MTLPLKKTNETSNIRLRQFAGLVSELSVDEKIWLSGFLAGQAQVQSGTQALQAPLQGSEPSQQLTILYGSQTGNGKSLAKDYQKFCNEKGLPNRLVSLADYKIKQLKKETHLVVIVSTHGEGEAPDDAEIFYDDLFSKKAPKLDDLKYSVLALGDSSYELFCQTGKDIDERLESLGANRIFDRVECDLDFESDSKRWQQKTMEVFSEDIEDTARTAELKLVSAPFSNEFSRTNPLQATLLEQQRITSDDSDKKVFHIEISIEDSGLQYQAGDSLAVIINNRTEVVNDLITVAGFEKQKTVVINGEELSLEEALTEKLEISLLNRNALKKFAQQNEHDQLLEIVEDFDTFQSYVCNRHMIDVVSQYPTKFTEQEFCDLLPKLTPRLYSISSSFNANPDEVHLTVSQVFSGENQSLSGLASGHLCEHLQDDDSVQVYIESNSNFRLPEKGDTPIIMIGAGTGVAPYRAFLQEREVLRQKGHNWLIFGNQRFDDDFLYQLEFQDYRKKGLLSAIDLAFSRDQDEKIYVQDRVRQKSDEIWEWLQKGAHLYICGGINMAKSVEQELLEMIQSHEQLDEEQAKRYLKDLKRDNRFQKDVY